ncbi:hypothetical protein HRbin10_00191 [bacterium HR10]|nr:hypothetical protein HRbin10_00191 [bacterium HR10]
MPWWASSPTLCIARMEIAANIRNLKALAALVILIALFLISAHLLAQDYQQRLVNWTANQTAQRDPIVGGVVRYELRGGHFYESLGVGHDPPMPPPTSLAVLVKGLEGDLDRPVTLATTILIGQPQEAAIRALSPIPDLAFVVKIIVSLLALFLSVDVLTREKEAATLRMVLANPLSRRHVLLGKMLGASASLLVPMVVAYASAVVFLSVIYGLFRNESEIMRLLLIGLGSAIYGLAFVHFGLLISTITTRTRTAVILGAFFWAAVVIVLPEGMTRVAEVFSPAPTYTQTRARIEQARRQILREAEARSQGELVSDPRRAIYVIRLLEMDRQLMNEYLARKGEQLSLARRIGMLSPATALAFGLSDLAGTGVRAYHAHLNVLRAGRDLMLDAYKRRFEASPEESTKALQEAARRTASLQRQPGSVAESTRAAIPALISIALWWAIAGVAAYWRFEQYDVR